MKKQTFTVPVWALKYLRDRERVGLTLEELALCQSFERQNKIACFLSSPKESCFSSRTNDIGGRAAMCTEATFSVRYTSNELFNRIVCRVDTSRGAPMGRQNSELNPGGWDVTPHFDRRVLLDSGAYDQGGAYWGFPGDVRVRFTKDGNCWQFYRSWTRVDDSLKLHT